MTALMQFCVFRAKKSNSIEREREREGERMSSRESDNTVSVIHCRPSVIFLNNEAVPVPVTAPSREVTEPSDYKRKVSKPFVYLTTVCRNMFGNYFLTEDKLCLETLTSQLCDGASICTPRG